MNYSFKTAFFRNLGYLVWAILLIFSLLFYQQRAFFMDGGFQLFNLINEGAIQIYHYRFVTSLPQIVPFILLNCDAPLWLIGMSFSVSYVLIYLLVYFVLVRVLKNEFLGWSLILLFTMISLDTFYHIQSEFYLGLALLLLVFGVLLNNPILDRKWQIGVILPLIVTVIFSHKLAIVLFSFLWLFFCLKESSLRHRRYITIFALAILVFLIKSIWFTNWYEAAKQADFKYNFEFYFPNFLQLPSNLIFLERCVDFYYMLPVFLFIVSAFYILKRFWLKLFLVWSFSAGYILMYNISDPLAPYRFYSEVTYLPLTIFVAVPFLFDLVPFFENRWKKKPFFLPAIFGIIIFVRLAAIYQNHHTIDRLFTWIEGKLEEGRAAGANKLLLKSEEVPIDTVLMEWGIPFTAALLSSLDYPKNSKTLLVLPDFDKYKDELEREDVFLSPFRAINLDQINRQYFDFGNGKYLMLE